MYEMCRMKWASECDRDDARERERAHRRNNQNTEWFCYIAGNWVFSLRNVETLSWLMQFFANVNVCVWLCRCKIVENRQWHEHNSNNGNGEEVSQPAKRSPHHAAAADASTRPVCVVQNGSVQRDDAVVLRCVYPIEPNNHYKQTRIEPINVLSTDRSNWVRSFVVFHLCAWNVYVSSLKKMKIFARYCCCFYFHFVSFISIAMPFPCRNVSWFQMSYGRAPWLYRNWFVWLFAFSVQYHTIYVCIVCISLARAFTHFNWEMQFRECWRCIALHIH